MAEEPVDLLRFEGEGNSVVLRVVAEQDDGVLQGELSVDSVFVRGRLHWAVFPQDLRALQEALDELDAGYDVVWCEGGRGPEMVVERDDKLGRLVVTVKDDAGSMTSVSVTVPVEDAWFDKAYERLDLVWKTWPNMAG